MIQVLHTVQDYNQIVKIDKLKYYNFSINKQCNDILQTLIDNKTIIKPNFEKTIYPRDTYKQYQKPTQPCHHTLQSATI